MPKLHYSPPHALESKVLITVSYLFYNRIHSHSIILTSNRHWSLHYLLSPHLTKLSVSVSHSLMKVTEKSLKRLNFLSSVNKPESSQVT